MRSLSNPNERLPCMNPRLLLAITLFVASSFIAQVLAQEVVSESPVLLSATILKQGPDASVTTIQSGTTITTKKVVATPFGNREVLAAMLADNLITGTVQDWALVLIVHTTGEAGLFARHQQQGDKAPVPVPPNLLSFPDLGPRVAGGITVTGKDGTTHGGLSETAFATLAVNGIEVSGLASSTPAKNPSAKSPNAYTGNTVIDFTGGTFVEGNAQLIKGTLEFSSGTAAPAVDSPK